MALNLIPLETRIHRYTVHDFVVYDDPEDPCEVTWEETDVVDILDQYQLTTCPHAWWKAVLLEDGSVVEGHTCNAAAQVDLYKVVKRSIDCDDALSVVGVFGSEQEAIDFMLGWKGDGDYLYLRHGYGELGSVDLWFDPGVYKPFVPELPTYGSSSYGELPF
ncbi:MAG: hypothetical protein K5859_03555 [Atopobiaceae bacterium]|nr:hypothetical protein [Atopobiaceae bacterium]